MSSDGFQRISRCGPGQENEVTLIWQCQTVSVISAGRWCNTWHVLPCLSHHPFQWLFATNFWSYSSSVTNASVCEWYHIITAFFFCVLVSSEFDGVNSGHQTISLVLCWLERSRQTGLWPSEAFRVWILHCTPLCFVLTGSGWVTVQFLMCLRHPPTASLLCLKFSFWKPFWLLIQSQSSSGSAPLRITQLSHVNEHVFISTLWAMLHLYWFALTCAHTLY